MLSVMRVKTLDEAIELVNHSPYGNATAIFTASGKSAREYSSRCEVGMVGVNVGVAAPMAFFPFAGWKHSSSATCTPTAKTRWRFTRSKR